MLGIARCKRFFSDRGSNGVINIFALFTLLVIAKGWLVMHRKINKRSQKIKQESSWLKVHNSDFFLPSEKKKRKYII
jgi:hypothetical protein